MEDPQNLWFGGTLRRKSRGRRIFGRQHLKTHLVNQSAIKRQVQSLMVLVGGASRSGVQP